MLEPGQMLGRYRLGPLIGEGGMGKVFKGFDSALERNVAIKILPADMVRDPSRVSRFIQEARTASALNHPHVITIYDIGDEPVDGQPERVRFIAMELIDGRTLRELIGSSGFELRKGLKIAIEVADGLAAAHAAGIIHRDLKPENIMVSAAGYAKVLDFGLAKLRLPDDSGSGENSRTMERGSEPGAVVGTVGYMSPEQAQGRPVDSRSDVFSLGCVLYEIATRRRAFQGDSSVDTLHRIIYNEPEPIRTLRPDIPSDLARIVRKALAKDSEARYQSVKEMAIDLRDLVREIDSNPSGTSLPNVLASPATPVKRSYWPAVAMIVAAVALTAVVMTMILRRHPPSTPSRPPDTMQITRVTANGKVISANISPDGKYIAYVVSDQGEQTLSVRQTASGQALTLIPARRTAYWGMTFAPDSASIYYGLKDPSAPSGEIFQVSTLGGAPRRIVEGIDSPPTFSPDGSHMAFLRARYPSANQSAVMVTRSDGSDVKTLATVQAPDFLVPIFFAGPSWSPDGKLIAASIVNRVKRNTRIVTFDATTGAIDTIASPGWSIAAQVAWAPDQKGLFVIANGDEAGRGHGQVWYLPWPKGDPMLVTNDLFDYRIVSLSADGKSLVTVASDSVADVWVARNGAIPKRINASKREGLYGLGQLGDGRLVITSIEAGKYDIWSMNEDGSGRTLLTRDENVNLQPVVSPDGRLIVYVSQAANGNMLCRMNADGSDRKVLAKTASSNARICFSPDGKTVVYDDLFFDPAAPKRPSILGLMRLSIDGGPATRVSDESLSHPAISPDGSKLAATLEDLASSRLYLAVLPLSGGPVTKIAEWDLTQASMVRWAQDGKSLITNTARGDRANLWQVPLDGSPPHRLTSFDEHTLFAFAPMRDGKGWLLSRGELSRDAVLITGFQTPH